MTQAANQSSVGKSQAYNVLPGLRCYHEGTESIERKEFHYIQIPMSYFSSSFRNVHLDQPIQAHRKRRPPKEQVFSNSL